MKYKNKIYISIFWVIIGIVLFGCGIAGILDSFWNGMGGALIGIGTVQIIRQVRYRTNEEYREKIDVENSDERNKFLIGRAWAWSGYAYVMLNALGTIGFKIAGNDMLSQFCGYSVCIVITFYWISFLILRKKY